MSEFAGLHNIDIPGSEFMPEQQAPAQQDIAGATAPQASGTERQQISVDAAREAPAL